MGARSRHTSAIRHTGAVCGLLALLRDPSADVSPGSGRGGFRRLAPDAPPRSGRARARGPTRTSVLGFNRLSIIDIAHSHQPLRWGPPTRRTATCWCSTARSTTTWSCARSWRPARRGVRHRRRRRGDHRRLPPLGHRRADRLRGMFAFALWDTVENELFCARDPFGIKPLFMATGAGGTAVGSEKKCLLDLAEVWVSTRHRRPRGPALHRAAVRARARDAAPRRATAGVGQLRPGAARRPPR